MAQSHDEKRSYSRGYQRAMSRASARVERVLKIARAYKEACTREDAIRCRSCERWSRGGPNCLWGYCRLDFEHGAGEGRMWADACIGEKQQRICTHENFGCINWIPSGPTPSGG